MSAALVRANPTADKAGRWRLYAATQEDLFTFSLPAEGELVVGRGAGCDIRIDDPSVAPRHLRLSMGSAPYAEELATDLGKLGGPGRRTALVPWASVQVGQVLFMFAESREGASTRVADRRYFELRLEEECHRSDRFRSSFGALYIRPDDPLQAETVEEVMAASLRAFDVIARLGPDEYAVLLADTRPTDAEGVAQRIRRALLKRGIQAHAGIASYPRDGRTRDLLEARMRAAAWRDELGEDAGETPRAGSAMNQIHRMLERVAPTDISVLILGETGVGKERLAEAVHRGSHRAEGPFVAINCAALVESLLESELFGYERGAFTGAHAPKPGLLELASGGTLFLDEIGELPMSIQVKLLRVIEERKVRRVGGLKDTSIDVRFVAATNRDLEAEVARGTFRADLFFRLNGIVLTVPPLRERLWEVESLVHALIAEACVRFGPAVAPTVSDEVLELFKSYSWPGNIRELRNVIERAVVLCTNGMITRAHVPIDRMLKRPLAPEAEPARLEAYRPKDGDPGLALGAGPDQDRSRLSPVRAAGLARVEEAAPEERAVDHAMELAPRLKALAPPELGKEIEAYQRQKILDALTTCGGNQTEAAVLLGISRRTLIKRLASLNIPRPRKRSADTPPTT